MCMACLQNMVNIPSLNIFERLWSIYLFFQVLSVGQTLRPPQNHFFETYTRARILGSDIINLWGSDPGFRFCRARNLAQQGKVHWKSGVVGWDFVGNARSDLTHVCDLQNPSRRPRHPYWRDLPSFLPSFLACMHPCMHACVHACIHDTRVHARRYHLFTFQVSLETRTNKTSECGSSARKMCLTITYDNVHERAIQRLLHLCVFVFFGKWFSLCKALTLIWHLEAWYVHRCAAMPMLYWYLLSVYEFIFLSP